MPEKETWTVKGTRNESGTAKKQETRRGRIPADSGARYRVTFVMVSAETSTSRRYTPVGNWSRNSSSDHQPTVNAVERVHDKFNLLASRTWFPWWNERSQILVSAERFAADCQTESSRTMEKWNIYVPDSPYSCI